MSTIERKEYQETKIMRTVSPVRNFRSSSQNLAEFDSNLGYLLEDLQNSVSRPSSSLGSHRETSRTLESSKTNSLNRFTNVKASNPVIEYASDDAYNNYSSPDGSKRVYKKETYSYKTSGSGPTSEKSRMQSSINQLDTLLDDLKQVKNGQLTEKESYNNTGIDPDSHTSSTRRTVHRELHYGDTPRSNSKNRSEVEESLNRDVQYTQEGNYGDIRQIRGRSPSPSSKTSTLTKQTKVTNVHNYPMEVVQTTTPDINPEILAHLDPNLHPPGNTKVTTTIKTYTYEIPGSGNYPTNLDNSVVDTEKYVYSPNQSQSTPSKSFVYKKVENKSTANSVSYPYEKAPQPGGQTVVKETVTTRNYQPGFIPEQDPNWNNQTYIYNETTTTKNNDNISKGSLPRSQQSPRTNYIIEENNTTTNRNVNHPYPNNQDYPQGYPPRQETYIIKEIHDTNKTNVINHPYPEPKDRNYPPPTQHYIKEIHDSNTTNNTHHRYPNGYPPNEPGKTVVYRHETHTTNNYGPGKEPRSDVETFDPHRPPYPNERKPNEPVNIQYRYKSESRTTNNYKTGYPPRDESEPLLPRPFPTDNNQLDGGPPKRLDELMANIGNEPPNSPYNAGFTAHEIELEQKKKIDTLKHQQKESEDALQKKEPILKSKNVSGPPVYYPPGHEMFAKKEESGAWRAEGGYEKASGKYKYEAESGSKSKSSSGAAIVPVCLPLCCGLPCTII